MSSIISARRWRPTRKLSFGRALRALPAQVAQGLRAIPNGAEVRLHHNGETNPPTQDSLAVTVDDSSSSGGRPTGVTPALVTGNQNGQDIVIAAAERGTLLVVTAYKSSMTLDGNGQPQSHRVAPLFRASVRLTDLTLSADGSLSTNGFRGADGKPLTQSSVADAIVAAASQDAQVVKALEQASPPAPSPTEEAAKKPKGTSLLPDAPSLLPEDDRPGTVTRIPGSNGASNMNRSRPPSKSMLDP